MKTKELKAILKCIYFGLLPPFIERKINGYVHYENECSYWQHLKMNFNEIYLIWYRRLCQDGKKFHGIL